MIHVVLIHLSENDSVLKEDRLGRQKQFIFNSLCRMKRSNCLATGAVVDLSFHLMYKTIMPTKLGDTFSVIGMSGTKEEFLLSQ